MSFAARSIPPGDRDDEPPQLGRREAAPADFFLGLSHEIFMIGHDSKQLRDAFAHALNCSAERRPEQLRLAIAGIRTRAEAIEAKAEKVEKMLSEYMGAKS